MQIGHPTQAPPAAGSERERIERLATLGTLAGAIAHEVNNLLTPVMSYAQMALASPEDAELCAKALQKAVEGAERASAAASSILGFIRGDEVNAVHVGHALRDALGCLARDPSKDGITLEVRVPEDAWAAIAPVRLQQVLLNLLLNARKAIVPRPGLIEVTAECSTWNTPTGTPCDGVEIVVRDTGCGMDAGLVERAFEPFVRGGERGGQGAGSGTGLGLPICRRIIEDSGGTIALESAPGLGTTVRIRLPRADASLLQRTDEGGCSTWNIGPGISSRAA
jgi:signal transduction histidine kinase